MTTMRCRARALASAIAIAIASVQLSGCGSSGAAAPVPLVRPRLVVLLVVDQMRSDYLERFRKHFTGGLKTFLENGTVFANANYEQWPTITAVGHATIATGATPSAHGIVGNGWYDRSAKKEVGAVEDPGTALVPTGARPGASPHNLFGTTLGDELRLATNGRGRVISVGLKDRSAIMLGGRRPNGAYWFDTASGTFVSSTYYADSLPAWVTSFNGKKPADSYFKSAWELLLSPSEYEASEPDDSDGESTPLGSRVFPHAPGRGLVKPGGRYYERLLSTPFANEMLFAFAREAVTAEQLGSDETPDLLTVALSANDIIGHSYGPYSREVEDITLRTDRAIGEFFAFLDDKVGKGNYLAVLSSDHGVAPTAARVRETGARYTRLDSVAEPIETALAARFGQGPKWIASIASGVGGGIYLDQDVIESKNLDPLDVQRAAASAALSVPDVRFALAAGDVATGRVNNEDLGQRRVAAGYCPGRSPDVLIVFDPFVVVMGGPTGTTHGTPYSYDSHVPLLFYGTGVPASWRVERVAVTDLATSVAALLAITPPSGCSGQPLLGVPSAPPGG
jgi:predicted AlkP superfamily pyrophosphatase or phosphodiesterase